MEAVRIPVRTCLALFARIGIPLALVFPAASEAQQALEEIVVTGSRIARDEFTSEAPLSVYDTADFRNAGVVTVDEFLKQTPAFTGFSFGTTTNNGNIGLKAVDLRGLGTKRTLVLINGRRQVGSFIGGNADVGAIDLNTIPHSMIERVEVLKDGASTIYGSDALGGVVNVILREDFDGAEFQLNYGAGTDGTSAESYGLSGLIGVTGDRGSVMIGLDYSRQTEMLQEERDWALFDLHPQFDAASGTFSSIPAGSSFSRRISSTLFDAAGEAALVSAGLGAGAQFIVDENSGEVREFAGAADSYNYSPINALVTPNERYQISAVGDYELTDNVTAFLEGSYTRRFSHQRLAPDASFPANPSFNGHWNDLVPASNPANPFGDTPANPWGISGQDVRLSRRFVESGGRLFSQDVDTYRIVLGVRGDIADRVGWEFAYDWAENEDINETRFYHRFDRWEMAVDPALCGADPDCVSATGGRGYLDPFGAYGTISPDEIAYLMTNSLKDVRQNDLQVASLVFDGELGATLGGGPIGWAAGFEHRRESARFVPDEFLSGGLTTSGAADPQAGSFSVDEIFGELLLPFTDQFALDASVRSSSYDTSAGDSTNFRLGATFSATDSLNFRGTYSTGFRAPNVIELFGGAQADFPVIEDPCEFYNRRNDINANVVANCIADGVPEDFEWGFQWQSLYTVLPNPNLRPEESSTLSVGAVFEPFNVAGLSVSVDLWDIEIDDLIDEPPYSTLLFACMSAADRTVTVACTPFLDGLGHTGIFPDDATVTLQNLGTVSTNGVDFNINYARPVNWSWADDLSLNVEATYLNSFKESFPSTGTQERTGTIQYQKVYPEWKINSSLTLSRNNWSATWASRYISSMDDYLRPANITDDAVAESIWYHDVYANFEVGDLFTVTIGLNNITDEEPPRFHSNLNAETEGGYYDVIGRRFFSNFTIRF